MRMGSHECFQITHTRIHACVCTRAHTYINTRLYNKEWWCFKLVGGLHNKAQPGAASLQHTLPLKRPKVADTGLAAFLTHTAQTHTQWPIATEWINIQKIHAVMEQLYIENKMISYWYNYYIRDINYSAFQMTCSQGEVEREKKNKKNSKVVSFVISSHCC